MEGGRIEVGRPPGCLERRGRIERRLGPGQERMPLGPLGRQGDHFFQRLCGLLGEFEGEGELADPEPGRRVGGIPVAPFLAEFHRLTGPPCFGIERCQGLAAVVVVGVELDRPPPSDRRPRRIPQPGMGHRCPVVDRCRPRDGADSIEGFERFEQSPRPPLLASIAEAPVEVERHRQRRLPAEVTESLRHPVAGIAGGRLDLERLFKRLARGAEIPLHQPCLAEEAPPLDHAGVTVKESEEDLGGGGRVPLGQERLDEAVDDDQRLRIGLERQPIVGFGPIEVATLQGRISQVPVGIGEIGGDGEGLRQKLFGPGFVAEVAIDRPEERPAGRISGEVCQERLGDLEAFVAEPRLTLGDVGDPRRSKDRPGGNIGRERLRIRRGGGLCPARPGPLVGSLESLPRRQFFVGVAASADDEDDENDEEAGQPNAGPRSP